MSYFRLALYPGVFNWLGNASGDSAFAYTFAIFLNAALVLSGYSSMKNDTMVLVAVGVLGSWDVLNCMRIDEIGWLFNVSAVLQLVALVGIVAVVLIQAPSLNPSSYVLFEYYNDTGFGMSWYVVVIGIMFSLYGFVGYDAPAHAAEETGM
jgi:amino acid transporter